MRRKYRRGGAPGARRRFSGKAVLVSATVGVLAAGTGISLAATQGGSSGSSVTCIAVADAAAGANSALSDVFAVGTALHLTSAGRAIDVKVSGPITAAAATTAPPGNGATTAPPDGSATTAPTASASASVGAGGGKHRTHRHKPAASGKSGGASASASADAASGKSRSAGAASGKSAGASKGSSAATSKVGATRSADPAASVPRVAVKAAANDGVEPNSVCVKLSKNAFNTLGGVADGNNVGAFIATMTTSAATATNATAGQGTADGRKHRGGGR
ncbi:hypothetical protein [Actinoplanes sp. NPDC026619]|uniref:hypothetical protein n=1 Tax=Actinoplanes sp. NPDC026619 TaxID=3155798 RepID=UPI0033F69509